MKNLLGKIIQITEGEFAGQVVEVVVIDEIGLLGVKLEDYSPTAHELNGEVPEGYGWWLDEGDYITEYKGFTLGEEVEIRDNGLNDGEVRVVAFFDIGYEPEIGVVSEDEGFGKGIVDKYGDYFCGDEIYPISTNEKNNNDIVTHNLLDVNNVELEVGDRVVVVCGEFEGIMGTVVGIDDDMYDNIAVELDKWSEYAHDCTGQVEYGFGYYFNAKELEFYSKIVEDNDYTLCDYCHICFGEDEDEDVVKEDEIAPKTSLDVGDVVRVVNPEGIFESHLEGYVGVIVKVDKDIDSEYPIIIEGIEQHKFRQKELEFIVTNGTVESSKPNVFGTVKYPRVKVDIVQYGRVFTGVAICDTKVDEFDIERGLAIAERRATKELLDFELFRLINKK